MVAGIILLFAKTLVHRGHFALSDCS